MRLLLVFLLGCAGVDAPVEAPAATASAQALSRDVQRLESTCTRGYLPACVALGVALQAGRELERNLVRAADLFEEACFKGYALACTHYGYALHQGAGRAQNDSEAIVQLKSACDAAEVGGCRYLGILYLASTSLEPYALPFLRQACEGNDSWSCWRLARELDGKGEDTTALYARACKLGLETACGVQTAMKAEAGLDEGVSKVER